MCSITVLMTQLELPVQVRRGCVFYYCTDDTTGIISTGKARMCILQLYYLAKFSRYYFDNSSSVCLIDSGIYVSFFEGTVPLAAFIFFLCLCYCPRLSWLIPVGSASNISHYHFISFILFSLHQQYKYK